VTRSRGSGRDRPAWEIADGVFCVGPRGRTQTVVYFVRSGASWVLIDAGWAGDGPRIARAGQWLFGDAHPVAILLTHCHPDHSGAASWLARTWGCRVHLHPQELPIAAGDFAAMQATANPLDRWVVLPMMRAIGTRRREAMLDKARIGDLAQAISLDDVLPGLTGWRCLPTPGHTPGHVAYYRSVDRVLISGDALVTLQVNSLAGMLLQRPGLSGPPWYTTWDQRASHTTLEMLARLDPALVAGGHGIPVGGEAIAVGLRRLSRSGDG
jgi:glyoxylase-like metal-dependent hydrolase (beta-lactamase superfamily II)